MKKDIRIDPVTGVALAVVKKPLASGATEWLVYLLNKNNFPLEQVMVSSRGYGVIAEEEQITATLRHRFPLIGAGATMLIELIQEEVFALNNEYWLSYFVGAKLYDKKYVLTANTILEANLTHIEDLGLEGVFYY